MQSSCLDKTVSYCIVTTALQFSMCTYYFTHDLPGNVLTLDDLGLLLEELLVVGPKWYHLGLQLGVRTGTLDDIQAQFHSFIDQLLEMLKTWLTTSDNPSWKTLTRALRSRIVGASQLADILERTYCKVKETEVYESKQLALAVNKDKDGWWVGQSVA